jgi:hypothetical protein
MRMADGEQTKPRDESSQHVPAGHASEPVVQIDFELRDRLPGGRAVIAVEQDGAVTWIADRNQVPPRVATDFLDEMRRMVREGGWEQNWPGVK